MKFQVKRVTGAQADMAKRIGLVKITASSAEQLFDLGVPLVIVGNKVNDYHFFGGFHLAMRVDSERYLGEGLTFKQMLNNWAYYNENSETGKAAFFVRSQYVASSDDVAAEAKKRVHKSKTAAKGKRRKSSPSWETTKTRRMQRRAAEHGIALKPREALHASIRAGSKYDDFIAERASDYATRRDAIAHGSNFYGGAGSRYPSVFDPRATDDVLQSATHEKFMKLPRPALPNPPRRAKKASRKRR